MRSQISAQVFIYILTAVVIGIIILVGYKSIATIFKESQKALIDGFKSSFTSAVEKMSRSYGSVSKFEIAIPEKFDAICFIDSMGDDQKFHNSANIDNAEIHGIVEDNAQQNVFLMKNEAIEEMFYVGSMDVLGDYVCVQNIGKPEVWLEAMGNTACLKLEKTEQC